MIAIPCVLYVDENNLKDLKNIMGDLDDKPIKTKLGLLLPDLDQVPYEIGNYETPDGIAAYEVDIKLEYTDRKEADPDTPAGDYHMEVQTKNSFEAKQRALDLFHESHPIGNLDVIKITTAVRRK